MADYYYLVASLPPLTYGETPPISSEEFLNAVRDALPTAESSELTRLSLLPSEHASGLDEIDLWNQWEKSLRNAIVRLRAKGDGALTERFEREGGGFFTEIENGLREAFAKSDPRERETHLDAIRWAFCDDLELGHDFDIVKLAAYRLKLLLCEKRSATSEEEKGSANYDAVIESVYDNGR
jgi:hypothetical protein